MDSLLFSSDPMKFQVYPGVGYAPVTEHSFDPRDLELGVFVRLKRGGYRLPTALEALQDGWGLDPRSEFANDSDQFARPSAASEVIQKYDVQRCITVEASEITPNGVAYELVNQVSPAGAVFVVEDVPITFEDVTALDENGTAIFTYGNLNGTRPCVSELRHPDPSVTEPLRWEFALLWSDIAGIPTVGTTGAPLTAYQGPILPRAVFGNHIVARWNDLRYGTNRDWGRHQQFLASSSSVARVWVILTGPLDRFRVTVGARLGGFIQLGGRKGAALDSAMVRRV